MCVFSARVKIRVARRASGRIVSPWAAASKERERDLNLPATQMDSDIDDDERMLPRRPTDAVGEAASNVPTGRASVPVREFDIGMDDSSSDTESVATVTEPPPSLLDALEQVAHDSTRCSGQTAPIASASSTGVASRRTRG